MTMEHLLALQYFNSTKMDLNFRTHCEKNLAGKKQAIRPLYEAGKCKTVEIRGPAVNEVPLIKSFPEVALWICVDNNLQTLRVFYENIPEKFRHKFDIVVEDETGLYQRVYALYKRSNLSFEDFQREIANLHNEVCNQKENELPATRLRTAVCISSLVPSQLPSYLSKFEAYLSSLKYKKLFAVRASDQVNLATNLYYRHLRLLATRAQVVYFADTVSNKEFSRTLRISRSTADSVVQREMQKAGRNFSKAEQNTTFANYAMEQLIKTGKNTELGFTVDFTRVVNKCITIFGCISSRSWTWEKCTIPPRIDRDAIGFSITCDKYAELGVLEYTLTTKEPKDEKKGSKVETKVKSSKAGGSAAQESSESETNLSTKTDSKEGAGDFPELGEADNEETDVNASATQKKRTTEGSTTLSDEEAAVRAKHLEAVALLD